MEVVDAVFGQTLPGARRAQDGSGDAGYDASVSSRRGSSDDDDMDINRRPPAARNAAASGSASGDPLGAALLPQRPLFRSRRRDAWLRHVVLLLSCVLILGNYFCYDTPGALNNLLREYLGIEYGDWQWRVNLLYSVYSLPNVLLPVVAGVITDRLGARRMIIIFSLAVLAGQLLFSLGIVSHSFWAMVAGRGLFGFGGETLDVVQAKVISDWYGASAFAFGVNLASARMSAAVNDVVAPAVGVVSSAWIGLGVCTVSLVAGLVLVFAIPNPILPDPRVGSRRGRRSKRRDDVPEDEQGLLEDQDDEDDNITHDEYRNNDDETVNLDAVSTYSASTAPPPSDMFTTGSMLNVGFILVAVLTIVLYGSVVPFFHICVDIFVDKFDASVQDAGVLMSIPDIISAIGSPLIGLLVDRVGYRASFIAAASLAICVSHCMLFLTQVTPVASMALLGAAYAVFAAVLWSCIPLLVAADRLGTAYGVTTVTLNLALSAFPIAVAEIRARNTHSWVPVGMFFIGGSALASVVACALVFVDRTRIQRLEKRHGECSSDETTTLETL